MCSGHEVRHAALINTKSSRHLPGTATLTYYFPVQRNGVVVDKKKSVAPENNVIFTFPL